MFNAASKLYFALAGAAVVVGFAYVIATSDRVGFTNLVIAGFAAFALALGIFAFVPREPLTVAVDEPAEPRTGDSTDVAVDANSPVLAALALGLLGAGIALDGWLILLGIVVGIVAVFAWLAQVWREHPSWTQDMTDRLNERFVVPFVLPGAIFLLAGAGVISLSRLFLAVSADAAPAIGIVVAFALLGGFYLLSTRAVGRSALATLSIVAAGLVLAAGVAGALIGEREFEHGGGGEGAVELAAENLAFDTRELDLPASTHVEVAFENKEAVPHNLAIYDAKGGEAIFIGEILNTTGETTYSFETPAAGTYYFQCDVHPDQMNGTVVVSAEAPGHSGTP